MQVRDLHATILHQLGIDHETLSFPFQGLDQRLTGVEKGARRRGHPGLSPVRPRLAWLGLLALVLTPAAQGGERPNVLWLTVEDMSPWIACYGDDTVPTPHLDRLAAGSIRYANAFATSPVCAPARSSLITGMYATRIGTHHMRTGSPSKAALEKDPEAYADIPSYEGVPPDFVRCFPELLRAAGYYCTNNSKTDYQFAAPATVWDVSGGKAHWRNRADGQPFFAVFNHGGTHESRAFPQAKRRPSAVAPDDVRVPPLYPDTEAVRDALARTYDNIAAMDRWVGERLAELEQAGLADTTVVLFFSDHGVGLPRGKRSPYDLGTRVPLLVRMPDGQAAGTVDERVVSFVDFGPTVLSLAGIVPDERLDGVAFLGPHARPGTGHAFAHADRFDSVYDHARSVSDGRFRYVRNLATDLPHLIPNAYRESLPMMRDLYALRTSEAVPRSSGRSPPASGRARSCTTRGATRGSCATSSTRRSTRRCSTVCGRPWTAGSRTPATSAWCFRRSEWSTSTCGRGASSP